MSDHIDGPRQIGDPSADLTDLFAFTSPENPARTVLAANVFPTCGVDAIFSNAINHSIVVRRAKVAGVGDATKFETSDPEIRFSCRFDGLERGAADGKPVQRGTCMMPDGQTLRFLVGDEKGASTPDGNFRVFAGMRSDPFILAWLNEGGVMRKFQNLLFNDNVLMHRRRIRYGAGARSRQGFTVRGDRRNVANSSSRGLCRTSTDTDGLGWPSRTDQCSTRTIRD